MAKLRRISDRNQVTLPPEILKEAGIPYGGLVEIKVSEGKIVLEPKQVKGVDLAAEDWEALDKLVKKQVAVGAYKEYASPEAAKKHRPK